MNTLKERYQDRGDKTRKPSFLQNFFIICSGADRNILNEYPTEWNKFSGIGATIFLTACLALLSGTYSIHFVFENGLYSLLFGIFWAIVIFNLDRYIVLSLRKEKIPTKTDISKETDFDRKEQLKIERKRLFLNQVFMASPRFFIALIIAITVSKPIELRLFQNRIEKQLETQVQASNQEFEKQEKARIDGLNSKLTSINKQEETDKAAVFSSNPVYQGAATRLLVIDGDIRTRESKIAGNNKIIAANKYKEVKYKKRFNPSINDYEQIPYEVWVPNATALAKIGENKNLITELQNLNNEIGIQEQKKNGVESSLSNQANTIALNYAASKQNIAQQIATLNSTYPTRLADWIKANKESADLPSRLEALGNISAIGNSIWWASFVITLLFIALETAPVIVKLLTKRGPYDERIDFIEYQSYIEENRKIDALNREVNEYMNQANEAAKLTGTLKLEAERNKLEIELKNNKDLLGKLADYQKELANIYAEAWFAEEKSKAMEKVKDQFHLKNSNKKSDSIEGIFWRRIGAVDKIEFFFRNGLPTENEFLYFENEQIKRGKWNYLNNKKSELSIVMPDQSGEYQILEITDNKLKLIEMSANKMIEFEKV